MPPLQSPNGAQEGSEETAKSMRVWRLSKETPYSKGRWRDAEWGWEETPSGLWMTGNFVRSWGAERYLPQSREQHQAWEEEWAGRAAEEGGMLS